MALRKNDQRLLFRYEGSWHRVKSKVGGIIRLRCTRQVDDDNVIMTVSARQWETGRARGSIRGDECDQCEASYQKDAAEERERHCGR